jgi:hypothetical protein
MMPRNFAMDEIDDDRLATAGRLVFVAGVDGACDGDSL